MKPIRLEPLLAELESVLKYAEQNPRMVQEMCARSLRQRSVLQRTHSELFEVIGQSERLRERTSAARAARARQERIEVLTLRIATYRRSLAKGVDADLAHRYLADIWNAEEEIRRIQEQDEPTQG